MKGCLPQNVGLLLVKLPEGFDDKENPFRYVCMLSLGKQYYTSSDRKHAHKFKDHDEIQIALKGLEKSIPGIEMWLADLEGDVVFQAVVDEMVDI